jgi:hypothetical protein
VVITVLGGGKKGNEREVETFARNVTVENCTLEWSGKFMWDYGYLWQITVWPEDYNEAERALAAKYFLHDLVRGCRLSALGDTMHIQKSHSIVFANNHITGSRVGAFFLAEYCKDATITGNTVDGTNGSRVVSVEKSCEDVTIVGNTFRNGGRGSWINQPRNFVLADSGDNASHAITFAPVGDTILVTDNIFSGPVRDIPPSTGCERVMIRDNVGLEGNR